MGSNEQKQPDRDAPFRDSVQKVAQAFVIDEKSKKINVSRAVRASKVLAGISTKIAASAARVHATKVR